MKSFVTPSLRLTLAATAALTLPPPTALTSLPPTAARSFRKICSTDRRGELRSPAFEVCIGVTEPVFLLICVAFYPDKPLPQCHVTIHYIYKPFI